MVELVRLQRTGGRLLRHLVDGLAVIVGLALNPIDVEVDMEVAI